MAFFKEIVLFKKVRDPCLFARKYFFIFLTFFAKFFPPTDYFCKILFHSFFDWLNQVEKESWFYEMDTV